MASASKTDKAKAAAARLVARGPQKATDAALAKFQESFLKNMGTETVRSPKTIYRVVSTGSLDLDVALGTGGWPVGRIHEIWGPEHAGKTTEAMMAAAEYQAADPDRYVAWIDMEQTFDSTWAQTLGVDLERIMVYNPMTAEDVADAARQYIESGMFSLVVLDSIGGMISRMEIQKDADQATVGQVPKIVTRMVKQAAPLAFRNDTTVMVINQVRAIIGQMHGPTESTGGGWALKHVTSIKMHVRSGELIKGKIPRMEGDVTIGRQVVNRIEKNKINGRLGRAQFALISQPTATFPHAGVDKVAETFDVAQKIGVLSRTAWVTLPDGEKINGRPKSIAYLRDKPETVLALRQQVLAAITSGELGPDDGEQGLSDEEMESI